MPSEHICIVQVTRTCSAGCFQNAHAPTYWYVLFTLQGAAMLDMVLQTLPRIAAEVAAPLSNCAKVTMVSTGDGEIGISKLTNEVVKVVEGLPALVTSLTGQDMRSYIPSR